MGSLARSQQCSISVTPVFEGLQGYGIDIPLDVSLENDDKDTRGLVTAANGSAIQIPVDLPHGGKKRVQILFEDTSFEFDYKVRYACGLGIIEDSFVPRAQSGGYYGDDTIRIALIGGESGELRFMAGAQNAANRPGPPIRYQDVYCTIEKAPERSYLYSPIDVVVLGEGAERLNDSQIDALHTFLITGGQLIFLGGASPQASLDPRWQSVLPVQVLQPVNLDDPQILKPISNTSAPPNKITVSSGKVKPGADATIGPQGSILRAGWSVGTGSVIFFGANPVEGALKDWAGRRSMVGNYLASTNDWSALSDRRSWSDQGGHFDRRSVVDNSPFRASLPGPGRIIMILGAYFLVVIPINFFILGKLRRGECAWFTAPIISIAFAWIFYLNAAEIYDKPQLMQTEGTLIADDRLPKAMYVGSAQMFFPTGGTFDLKLSNVEAFRDVRSNSNRGPFGQMSGSVVERLDVGQIIVPVVSLPSFSFREFRFTQAMANDRMFVINITQVKKVGPSSFRVTGSIANRTKLELESPTINLGDRVDLKKLLPGETKDFSVEVKTKPRDSNAGSRIDSPMIVLRAKILNKRFGPEFGKIDYQFNADHLMYTFNLKIPEELQ